MKQPKREPAYGWLNRWLGKEEEEGSEEPPLAPLSPEELRSTATGYTLRDLGGESGQTLNATIAENLRKPRLLPDSREALERILAQVRDAVQERIGLRLPQERNAPECASRGTFDGQDFIAEKLLIESEPGIHLPALWLQPRPGEDRGPVVLHVAEEGKPREPTQPSLALALVRAGHSVLSVDVRGAGETDPRDRTKLPPLTRHDPAQFRFDSCAVRAAQLGTTLLGMRTFDVVRALDYLAARQGLTGRPVVLVGEGLGGVWALAAAAFDSRPAAVVCVKTVPSYRLIVDSQYYASRDYFWVPRALESFDLPDLAALVAPRVQAWIDPLNAMLEPLDPTRFDACCDWPRGVYLRLEAPERLQVRRTAGRTPEDAARQVIEILDSLGEKGAGTMSRVTPALAAGVVV